MKRSMIVPVLVAVAGLAAQSPAKAATTITYNATSPTFQSTASNITVVPGAVALKSRILTIPRHSTWTSSRSASSRLR
jgi:hypothetical protein